MKFEFKIDRDLNIVCYKQAARQYFPPPHKDFKLAIENVEYRTSVRNLSSGCTSIAKTFDASGQCIARADLCRRHGLRQGQTVCIEVLASRQLYRLIKSVMPKSSGEVTPRELIGQKPIGHNRLTLQVFATQIGHWYEKYTQSPHFQRYRNIELGLTQKASDVGYLEPGDLLEIAIWGSDEERHQLGTRICGNNTYSNIVTHTREAIRELDNPRHALGSLLRIRYVGPAYGSKTLRCVCPEKHAAFDYHVRKACQNMLPKMHDREAEVSGYVMFLEICRRLREQVTEAGPRPEGLWYIADIEMALFQFALEGGMLV